MYFPRCSFLLFILFAAVSGQTPPPQTSEAAAPTSPAPTSKEVHNLVKEGSAAIPQLQAALASSDGDIRVEAVKALVSIGGPKTVAPLVVATHDNSEEIQIRATDGLVNAYLPGYLPTGWTAPFHKFGSMMTERFSKRDDRAIEAYVIVSPDVFTVCEA